MTSRPAPIPPLPFASSRFELRREIGAGGFGIVYEAYDHERGLAVALKTLRRATPEAEARLKREFRSLVDLTHKHLVAPYDLVASSDGLFFTMELVDGVDFLQWVRPGGSLAPILSTTLASGEELPESGIRPLPREPGEPSEHGGTLDEVRLRKGLAQLVDALTALHDAGIVHRDLKPSNVLVRRDGRVAVLDYGLASLLVEPSQVARRFEGTPAYAAPEQAYGRPAGPAADFYAAGVMLFQALTGRLPFDGSSRQVLLDKETLPAPGVRTFAPDAPLDLAVLADTWLRWDPEQRVAPISPEPALSRDRALVGRSAELAALRSALERSRARGVRVLVEGSSGIGKTALITRFSTQLGLETIALHGRCHPREVVAFNAFDGVIDRLARVRLEDGRPATSLLDEHERQALGRMFPALRDESSGGPDSSVQSAADPSCRARAIAVLRSLLAALAERGPVVLLLDDAQWMDHDSQDLLDQLFREPCAPRLLTVLIQRSDIASALPPFHDSLVTRLVLGPLAPAETIELATRLTGRAGLDVTRLAQASAGHPMFVRELVAQSLGRPSGLFETVDDALHERIGALPAQLGEVLAILSLSTASLDESDLAIAVRRDTGMVLRNVDELRSRSLVRLANDRATVTYEPSHDRIREIARARIPKDALPGLHRRIAKALARDPRPATLPRLALHLAEGGQRDAARVLAERAGERAEAQLAFGQAAALFRLALSMGTTDAADRLRLRRRLATVLAHGHRAVEAAEEYLSLALQLPTAEAAPLELAAARLLLASGDLQRGVSLLSRLLSRSGQTLPRTTAEGILALVQERGRLAIRGRQAAPFSARSASPEALAALDLAESVSEGFSMVDPFRAAIFQARALRLALDTGDPIRIARLAAVQAIHDGLADTEPRQQALARLPALRSAAVRSGDALARGLVDAAEAVLLALDGTRRGNIEGLASVEERLERETRGSTWAIGNARLLRVLSMRLYGDFEALRRMLPGYVRDAEERRDRHMATSMRRGSAFLFLAADEPAAARAALASTSWPTADETFHVQHWLELDALAEIDLYEGEAAQCFDRLHDRFAAYDRSFLHRVQRIRTMMLTLEGRLALAAAATGHDPRGMRRRAERAARKLAAEDLPYAALRALLLEAGLQNLGGHRERATSALERALHLADREGTTTLAAATRLVLSRLVLGDRGRQLRRVAEGVLRRERVLSPEAYAAFEIPGL